MVVGTKAGAVLRTLGLWVLILCASAMLFWFFATGELVWLGTMTPIMLWIFYKEAYGLLVGYPENGSDGPLKKMTISTAYKLYIQRVGSIGYIPLIMFWLAMTGLVLHLAVW